jgi:hypothetical protein
MKSSSHGTGNAQIRYERSRFILLLSFIIILTSCQSSGKLTLFYSGNLYGTLEDCGCPKVSEGNILNHITFYKDSIKNHHNSLYISAGNLFAPNRGDRENLVIHDIIDSLGYDLLFHGKSELNVPDSVLLPEGISYNIADLKSNKVIISGNLKIAVTGMTDPQYKRFSGRNDLQEKTISGIADFISELKKSADIVVFISNLENILEKQVFNEIKDIDVMISNVNSGNEEFAFGGRLYLSHGMFGEYIGKLSIRKELGTVSIKNSFVKMELKTFKEDAGMKRTVDSLKTRYGIESGTRDEDF